jgi:hypothetical protein
LFVANESLGRDVQRLTQLNHTLFRELAHAAAQRRKESIFEVLRGVVAPLREIFLGGVAKDQPIEVGVVSQWVQVVIVLCTDTQVRLQVQSFLE